MSELGYIEKKVVVGEKLTEQEIEYLIKNGNVFDEIKGEYGKWQRKMRTIIEINDELYSIDWLRGLEYPDDAFWEQPYKVKRVEKMIKTIEYVEVE